MAQSTQQLLSLQNLRVVFPTPRGDLRAVDGIDLNIGRAETVGLVGESGSGKTVTGRAILNLIPPPGRIVQGKVIFKDRNLLTLSVEEMRKIRGKEITGIQQDPQSALNPAFKVESQMIDILMLQRNMNKSHALSESVRILHDLGIDNPMQILQRYPHQLSGGMAQRIMIGIAFSCEPSLVVADEPTTALDVITQASVIKLMKKFQSKTNTSILFITHNLGLAAKICDKIAVMYAGKIVEFADVKEIFRHPSHPYTRNLLSSVPKISDSTKKIPSMPGGMPDLVNPPNGCRFYPRCSFSIPQCTEGGIKFQEVTSPTERHIALCIRAKEVSEI